MKYKRYSKFALTAAVLLGVLALAPAAAYPVSTLRLDKTVFSPNEEIAVHFTVEDTVAQNAWIGIIPAHVAHGSEAENDRYDLAYQYLNGMQSGTLIFKAPGDLSMYDFRMHDTDDNGREIASVSFQVGGFYGTLSLEKNRFAPDEEIKVYFTTGPGFAENAWVGIIPAHVAHGSEAENDRYDLTYRYLKGVQSGMLAFRAPAQAGTYDFRMHNTDDNGIEVASVSFQVGD